MNMHQMASLLTDIHTVDGNMANLSMQPDSLVKHGMGLYLAAFKMHHTDSAAFRRSLQYYSHHPDQLAIIYDGVGIRLKKRLDSLTLVQTKIEKKKRLDPHFKADSIKAKHKADSLLTIRTKHIADSVKKAEDITRAQIKKLAADEKKRKRQAKLDSARFTHAPKPNK